MDYEQLLNLVAEDASLSREGAQAATEATLEALAARISYGEAADLAQRLPYELRAALSTTSRPQRFGVEDFLEKVAQREGTSRNGAELHARAVFAALHEAAGAELRDVIAQLPDDFAAVVGRAGETEDPSQRSPQDQGLSREGAREKGHGERAFRGGVGPKTAGKSNTA